MLKLLTIFMLPFGALGAHAEAPAPPSVPEQLDTSPRLEMKVLGRSVKQDSDADDFRETLPIGDKAIGLAPLPPAPAESAAE